MSGAAQQIAVSGAQRPLFVGVDVGGTNIKIGLVDDLGRTAGFVSIATDEEKGAEDAIQRIGAAIRSLLGGRWADAWMTSARSGWDLLDPWTFPAA